MVQREMSADSENREDDGEETQTDRMDGEKHQVVTGNDTGQPIYSLLSGVLQKVSAIQVIRGFSRNSPVQTVFLKQAHILFMLWIA